MIGNWPSQARPSTCPFCRHEMTHITHADDTGAPMPEPRDGDCTMCIECGRFSIISSYAPGNLRRPNVLEAVEMARHPDIMAHHKAWLATQAAMGKPVPE